MATDRNAIRRLRTLLADEDYGPKLARLRGADERRVLDLISENRGREARAEILAADQRRLQRERQRRRETLLQRAVDNTVAVHRPYYPVKPLSVRQHLLHAEDAELRFAATATREQLLDRIRARPPATMPEINPFWYH